MDDIFVIQTSETRDRFIEHINNFEPALKCTVEDTRPGDSVIFGYGHKSKNSTDYQ